MKVECEVQEILKDVDVKIQDKVLGKDLVPGVKVVCSKCGHTIEAIGQDDIVVKKCLNQFKNECPGQEVNLYVEKVEEVIAGVIVPTIISATYGLDVEKIGENV